MSANREDYRYQQPWLASILRDLDGNAWTTGIESDRKQRGESINVDVHDSDNKRQLAVIEVRQCRFRPGRFNRVRKDYYLVGRNENGNPFAHPIDVRATNARVEMALCRIWETTPGILARIIRQGDVALIPDRVTPELFDSGMPGGFPFLLADSHIIKAEELRLTAHNVGYVRGHVEMKHTKSQHAFIAVELPKGKWFRVALGVRAATYRFSSPTAD